MNIEQYKNFLLSRISGARLASGGREIQCRCFNTSCEDYYDYRSKGHFYISIPEDDEPSKFNCFKCGYSGIVNHNRLLEWNIYESSMAEELYKYNSSISNKPKNDKYFNRKVYSVYNTIIRDDEVSNIKLNYINNRLGTNLSFIDIRQLKIILNLLDTINENHISELTRQQSIVQQLDINFVGFLSIDNAFVNMRRLVDKGLVYKSIDKRYINYKLYNKFDNSERFYVVPTMIRDLYSPNPIKINISEGPFDILSVYLNMREKEEGIYIAGTGCNYFGIILYCLEVFGIINAEIHLYMEDGEKDFGVRLENITESIQKVL